MSVRVNYDLVIKDIEKNFNGRYEITQHVAKRVGNGEFPKSLFNKSYINQEKNALARYIKEIMIMKFKNLKLYCIQKKKSDFLSCFVDFLLNYDRIGDI